MIKYLAKKQIGKPLPANGLVLLMPIWEVMIHNFIPSALINADLWRPAFKHIFYLLFGEAVFIIDF